MQIYIALALVLAVAGLAFSIENPQLVEFGYFAGQIELPLSVLLVGAFGAGALFTVLVVSVEGWLRRGTGRSPASGSASKARESGPAPVFTERSSPGDEAADVRTHSADVPAQALVRGPREPNGGDAR